jgi:hypothetical protein
MVCLYRRSFPYSYLALNLADPKNAIYLTPHTVGSGFGTSGYDVAYPRLAQSIHRLFRLVEYNPEPANARVSVELRTLHCFFKPGSLGLGVPCQGESILEVDMSQTMVCMMGPITI